MIVPIILGLVEIATAILFFFTLSVWWVLT